MFTFTLKQQISFEFCLFSLFWRDRFKTKSLQAKEILKLIHGTIPKINVLTNSRHQPDWMIVWGPAVYTFPLTFLQDNMMFVAQQVSQPNNYVVAIRGTNGMGYLGLDRRRF